MKVLFQKITDFDRGILHSLLLDAYSFDERYRQCFEQDWIAFDRFFFDHPLIAEKYGFMTVLNGEPIGHISWDPRNRPAYVTIGHNCIATKYKGMGYGKRQLSEAVRRIKGYDKLQKIVVETNENLIARYNYESVGFRLTQSKKNDEASAFAGNFLEYEMLL